MRQKRTTQISLFDPDPVDHSVGAMLETISAGLVDLGGARDSVGRGLPRFRAWVNSVVFTHNLVRLHPSYSDASGLIAGSGLKHTPR